MTTLLLVFGHLIFKGFFTPVLVYYFALELHNQLKVQTQDAVLMPLDVSKQTRFYMGKVAFVPSLIAIVIWIIFLFWPNYDFNKIFGFPILGFGVPQHVSTVADNKPTAGFIAYMLCMPIAIYLRGSIAHAYIEWMVFHTRKKQAALGFTNAKAYFFCVFFFACADLFVGFLGHYFSYHSKGGAREFIVPLLVIPSGVIAAAWFSALALIFTNIFKDKP
jgi:hypothetical protein